MKVYTTDRIRNVVVLGHGGSGKTSLVEALAYMGGITSRLGSVALVIMTKKRSRENSRSALL